jgi:hypothetical protein
MESKTCEKASSQLKAEKLEWEQPQLTSFGKVAELTQQISYIPGDGISNASH